MADVSRWLTVAIPTHNRSAILRQTLGQLTRVTVPAGFDWEVIVAQNNCSDDTASMLAEFRSLLPLRALSEPRPGVNHARNAAVEAARGEIIVFTDDDTLPAEGWLVAYVSAFDASPHATVFGGPIAPHFTSEPPSWLREALPLLTSVFGGIEARERGVELSSTFFPFGTNMAFRTAALRARPFDPTLGPRGKTRINGSEKQLILHLLASGHAGRWVEDARVRHCIQPKQMTIEFLRWYWTGEGAAMAATPVDPATKMLWGKPRWLWRESIAAELRYRGRRLRGVESSVWQADLAAMNLVIPILTSGAVLAEKEKAQASFVEACAYIDLASTMGIPYVRVMGTGQPQITLGDLRLAAGLYGQLCEYAEPLGVMPLLETNGDLSSSAAMRSLIKRAGTKNCGVLWDVHHTVRFGGESPVETIANIGNFIKHVHVKDSVMAGSKLEYRMLGYGDIPVADTLLMLKALRYNGFISLEWVKRWNPDLQEPGIVFAHYKSYMDTLLNAAL